MALAEDSTPLRTADGTPGEYRRCANRAVARCNWLVAVDDTDVLVHELSADIGAAHRLRDRRHRGLRRRRGGQAAAARATPDVSVCPSSTGASTEQRGLAFELLSSRGQNVITGHEAGVITLDLSESDDAHREFVRQQLGEAYRTVLGHLRHEIGHYYWPMLVARHRTRATRSVRCSATSAISYDAAMRHHYDRSAGELRLVDRPTSASTPPCTRGRTGPRPSPTTCTSSTGSRPPSASGSSVGEPSLSPAPRRRSSSVGTAVGPDGAAVAGAHDRPQRDGPFDRPGRPLPVRPVARRWSPSSTSCTVP